jgi:hypothetical protein
MNKRLLEGLSLVASRELQMKMIVEGTTNNYLVPEELIDSVRTEAERLLSNSHGLRDGQRDSVRTFLQLAERAYAETLEHGSAELYELIDGVEWARMRAAAKDCLDKLNDHAKQAAD